MFGSRKIRCALVHDHTLLRQGLRRLMEDEPDIEIVSESEDAVEALRYLLEYRPEVVITDAAVFGFAPEKVEVLLGRLSPPTRVLFLSMNEDAKLRVMRPQASCSVKNASAQELFEKIRLVHATPGGVRELPRKARTDWSDVTNSSPRALTVREREVLKLLAEGQTVRSAASTLGLSVKTVDAHKFNLMRKLGIHNKAELVMWAIRKRLVKIPSNL